MRLTDILKEIEEGSLYNPSEELFQIIMRYANKNDPFIFGQYSDVHKLGINPKTRYNTPTGIYAYPLIWFSPNDVLLGNLPFASDRKYIVLFTVKPSYRDKIVFISNDGKATIGGEDKSIDDEIEDWINTIRFEAKTDREYDDIMNAYDNAYISTPFGRLWNITREMRQVKGNPAKWAAKLQRDFKIHGVVDTGAKLIHTNEPTQAVFFSKEPLQLITIVPNPREKEYKRQFSSELNRFETERFGDLLRAVYLGGVREGVFSEKEQREAKTFFQNSVGVDYKYNLDKLNNEDKQFIPIARKTLAHFSKGVSPGNLTRRVAEKFFRTVKS